jgi:ribosomal protein S18 acetylase RimI-like enzyme
MRLVPWKPDDLARRLDDVIEVYGDAMGYRPDVLATRRGYISTHLRRPGFRAVATLATDGSLVGFGYGYHSAPGQWWHDQVSAVLTPAARVSWLTDCFEVVELHVRTAAHGHGLGTQQLRALLHMAEGSTTLLSTPETSEHESRAWRLYRRFGFIDVVRHLTFPGDARKFAVLGRTLPIDDSDRSPHRSPERPGPPERPD